jgi:hypothetical protein
MCRYMEHPYKTHWVCVPCRHVAKYDPHVEPRCPTCQEPLIDFGRDFKAPRKLATNQWRKLEILVAKNLLFKSCGCTGPGRRPKTLADAKRV